MFYFQSQRNDREEIRRKLAMGVDEECFTGGSPERLYKKSNLTSRLQGGMNLQICFMNETEAPGDELDERLDPHSEYSPETVRFVL